jgi:geranylgeranyl diphosphate synthase type II
LKQWFTEPATDIDAKIAAVKEILMFQVVQATQDAIQDFTFKAFDTLDKKSRHYKKEVLRAFGENLMGRQA